MAKLQVYLLSKVKTDQTEFVKQRTLNLEKIDFNCRQQVHTPIIHMIDPTKYNHYRKPFVWRVHFVGHSQTTICQV
jgi:DUF1680 family protein